MALDPVTAVLNIGSQLIDRFIPDKAAAQAAKDQLAASQSSAEFQLMAAQIQVDNSEAQSTDPLQHWRGALGWVCTSAFGYHYVLFPIVARLGYFTDVDTSTMYPLLLGMLGLAGAHVTERVMNK